MVRLGPYLYQSPASYYTQTKSWDLTPGYETERHLDFTHQITGGCLFCHTGSVNLVAGTVNQFRDPPFTAITCERCHGPSAEHLRKPAAGSIVNPAKLEASRRDSVCEQCHLEGEVRVLNPGKDWWDFRPGMATESVFATYLSGAPRGNELRAVSQSELLARSQCARQSGGRLWCGTCHDPHGVGQNRERAVTEVCISCHRALFAASSQAPRHPPATECVSCHMPRLRPTNVAHSAITDHSIPRVPGAQQPASNASEPELRAWREPGPATGQGVARRDLGMAYFEAAAGTHASADLQQAYQILSRLPVEQRQDAAVEADLGSILLADGNAGVAMQMFANAAARQPANARYLYCLGTALERAGRTDEAVDRLKRSITLDPSQPDAYLELARIYNKTGRSAASQNELQEYLHFMPQNIQLRLPD
jgi:hypothetical protein